MIKYAINTEAQITKFCESADKGTGVMLKFANKTFGSVLDIPRTYHRALSSYASAMDDQLSRMAKTAGQERRIGSYDPEFHYYRVIALHGDVFNDNGDMFRWGSVDDPTMPELMRYDDLLGQNVYQTFVGRGNFKNHQNDDVSKAVGVILDVVPNMDGRYIEALLAVDSKKDPDLVRSIDKGYVNAVSMGCFRAGTPISLSDGYKVPIEKIGIGQMVLTHLGNARAVRNLQCHPYEGDLYKIKVMGVQKTLDLTKEHPIWTISGEQFGCQRHPTSRIRCTPQNPIRRQCKYHGHEDYGNFTKDCQHVNKKYNFKFTEAKDVRVGDWVAYPFSKEVNTPKYADRDLARLMGYYLSEGYCLKNRKKERVGICFCFNPKEKEYISEVIKLCNILTDGDNKAHLRTIPGRDNIVYVDFFDKKLTNRIYNLCGEYAKHKRMDEGVLSWSPELQLEIIGTFINGDGCCIKTKYHNGTTHLATASKVLADQFFIMLLRNDIVSIVNEIRRNRDRKINGRRIIDGIQYQVNIGTFYNDVLRKVSSKIKVPEKTTNNFTKRRFIYENYLIARITGIQKERIKELVYNFEVEDDNSYVANDIAVHNCRVAYSICSICGNVAKTEADYCQCIQRNKGGKIWNEASGEFKDVYEDNRGCNFIELSWVTVPADRYALMLEKVAHGMQLSDDTLYALGIIIDSFGEQSAMRMIQEIALAANQVRPTL